MSPIVCLIGANEVGKTTLLQALSSAYSEPNSDPGEQQAIAPLDRTRDEDIPDDREIIRLRYCLETDDLKVLDELPAASELSSVRYLDRKKSAGGTVVTELIPTPVRDKTARHKLAQSLAEAVARSEFLADGAREGTPADPGTLSALDEPLRSDWRNIPGGTLDQLVALAAFLEENEAEPEVVEEIRHAIEFERRPHPLDQGLVALVELVPRFVRFDDTVRNLADEYDVAAVLEAPPQPLLNIARLAGLDLRRFVEKVNVGETGTVKDLIDDANAELRRQFEAWTQQPPVSVNFDHSGTRLFVHVKSGSGTSMRIGERSDGLRQFVALVALTANQGHRVPPILLIDELEMHLHYDAQADLIGVLTTQQTASQIVYTTHSAAALPEDLGTSVR